MLESMTYNKRLLSYVGKFIEKQESLYRYGITFVDVKLIKMLFSDSRN